MAIHLGRRHLDDRCDPVVLETSSQLASDPPGDVLEVEGGPMVEVSPGVGVEDVLVREGDPELLRRDIPRHGSHNVHLTLPSLPHGLYATHTGPRVRTSGASDPRSSWSSSSSSSAKRDVPRQSRSRGRPRSTSTQRRTTEGRGPRT